MTEEITKIEFSAEIKSEIDAWVAKYPPEQKQSAIIPALLLIQESNNGWLSRSHLNAAADYLNMPHIAVYEVATFYTMYELKPIGRNKICVCTNVSCQLAGSEKIMSHLQNRLGINIGETSADGLFTLKEVECLAACCGAPMMQINKEYYEHLTPEKVDEILAQYQAEGRKS